VNENGITAPVSDLYATATKTKRWFLSRAGTYSPDDWNKHGGLRDSGSGAVYAFFGNHNKTLYVGQTGASLKARAKYETSCHYDTKWWKQWRSLRFLNFQNGTDRLAVELLLILALEPRYNVKPCFRPVGHMRKGLTIGE
jgi:hypothetical protein